VWIYEEYATESNRMGLKSMVIYDRWSYMTMLFGVLELIGASAYSKSKFKVPKPRKIGKSPGLF
jgi:hypothetical protein